MTGPQSTTGEDTSLRRRTVVLAGVTGLASLAGCQDFVGGDGGPRDRSFDVTITRSGGDLQASVDGGDDVEGVVTVNVEDSVTFTFANETDEPVGVHDHASDAEVVIEPGGEETIAFEATEAMVGRQEIEAWIAEDGEDADSHGGDATVILVVEVRPRGS